MKSTLYNYSSIVVSHNIIPQQDFTLIIKYLIFTFLFIISSSIYAKPSGEQLYSSNCSACHGANGDGGVGVPLSLPDFQYGVTNDYLKKSIRLGRPGRIMPAFTQLSDAEVTAIVKYIRKWAPGKPFPHSNKKISGNISAGQKIYMKSCAACHGDKGQGGKGTGVTFSRPRDFPVIAPALNNKGFLSSATDLMIKTVLMNGRDGTPMPSFLKQGLSEDDINNVVSYVRSFEKTIINKKTEEGIAPLISYTSPDSLKDTVENIKRAIIGKNFKIIRQQYLNQGLAAEGQENTKQIIIYFCNFNFLNKALTIDPRVGLFLPCRITVVEKNNKVSIIASNPLYMSRFFNNEELHKLCKNMHDIYTDIIEESTF